MCLLAVSLTALHALPAAELRDDPVTTDAPTDAPSTIPPRCIPECPAGKAGKVPHLCDCQRYFVCDKNGQATPGICLPWENFDERTSKCVFWDRADCSAVNPTTMPPPTTAPPVVPGCDWEPQCPADKGKTNIGVPCKDSCKIYIECGDDGKWTKKTCPVWQPWFDTKSGKCVLWGGKCAEDQ